MFVSAAACVPVRQHKRQHTGERREGQTFSHTYAPHSDFPYLYFHHTFKRSSQSALHFRSC